jgi:hypothetical protein
LLGIDTPFYVAYEDASLASWIEDLDGLILSLTAPAVYLDTSEDPALQVEIRPGDQTLDSSEALAFVTAPSASGDMGVLGRQGLFFRALLRRGVEEQGIRSVRGRIRATSSEWETNLTLPERLEAAEVLHEIPQNAVRSDELRGASVEIDGVSYTQPSVVETERIVAAALRGASVEIDGVSYTQPSVVETERIVAAALRGVQLLTPSDVTVAVFNGSGVRLLARKTADYLLARGFQVSAVGNAEAFDYDTSYVLVLTDEAKAWILRDALPSTAQVVFPETFESHYAELKDFIPVGTDLVLIAGPGLEIE